MKKLLLPFLLTFCFYSFGATVYVTNTNDSGAGSLRDAIANCNMGDIIRLDQSLLAGGSDTITLLSPVNITKGLFIKGLINGADTLFLSGGGSSSVFHINITLGTTYPHLDFDSLVFIDGNGAGNSYGGAIQFDNVSFGQVCNFYIRNCVFRNNTAPFGGAIGSYKSDNSLATHLIHFELSDCLFKSNTASGAGSDGGAIYIYRKKIGWDTDEPKVELLIDQCNFLSNSSNDMGGAIYIYADCSSGNTEAEALVTVTGSTFDSNQSINAGGAIYMYSTDTYAGRDSQSILNCSTSTITNNHAVTNGGALYVLSSNITEFYSSACTIMDNTALNDGSAVYVKSNGTSPSTASIYLGNSIFAFNNGNTNYNNTIYLSANSTYFSPSNYNIFDCAQSDLPPYFQGFDPDFFNADASDLNLLPLALNSRNTYTRIPDFGSMAINAGNSWFTGDAQNAPILGLRDIGAAESAFCDPVPVSSTASVCQGSTYDFYGQSLSSAGTYTHTIVTPGACDSVITLTFTLQTPTTPTIHVVASPGNTIMFGTPVTITASITGGGTSPFYQWFANGSPVGPNSASIISSNLTNGTQLSCMLISNAVCVTNDSILSNIITFTVHPNNDEPCNAISLPVNQTCEFSYYANDIATNTPNVGAHSCASNTSHDIWFSFVAPASGNVDIYTLSGTLTDAVMSVYDGSCNSLFEAGCADDVGLNTMPQGFLTNADPDTVYYIRVSSWGSTSGNFAICVTDAGVNELNDVNPSAFSVYPNPSNGTFSLDFQLANAREIKIYNTLGAVIYREGISTKNHELHLNELQNGIYFIEVEEGGTKVSQKLVIEN